MAKIALDIGHGNNTFPPSKGVHKGGKGYAEHDFNSKLGIRIKALLEAHGHTVILGQQPFSRDVPLTTRTNLYNRENVDLVVSLHANAGVATAEGRCVFYWHTSDKAKRAAELVVDEIKKAGYTTHGNGLHASMRGRWTDLHITRETKAPAILIEHGFMTNEKDFELIFGSKQAKYIEDMAQADVKAIQRYFGELYKAPAKAEKPKPVAKPSAKPAPAKPAAKPKTSAPKAPKPSAKGTLPNATYYVKSNPSERFNGTGVRAVQEALASVHFYPKKGAKNNGIDGWYGPDTADAVRRFQLMHGLKADGVYGPATQKVLERVRKNK